MVKRFLVSVSVVLLASSFLPLYAQYYYLNDQYYGTDMTLEVGGSVGAMNALTDVGGRKGIGKGFIKDLTLKTTRPSFSVYALAMYKEVIGLRIEGTFGSVVGYDSILKKDAASTFGRYERNLSFRSKINDFQLSFELHPLFFKSYEEDKAPYFSPYLVAGVGFFTFNPQAKLNDTWYDLQPLRTEGQGFSQYPDSKPYKLGQFNIPLGLGLRYELGPSLNARLEIVHRFLFTDYLDDVSGTYINPTDFYSNLPANQAAIAVQLYNRDIREGYIPSAGTQRGNSKDKDAYFSIQLKLGMIIRTTRRSN